MSFANKLNTSRNHLVRVVTGKCMGREAWWIIQVLPQKMELYKMKISQGVVNLDEYSKVLTKGWGNTPPDDVVLMYEKQYA